MKARQNVSCPKHILMLGLPVVAACLYFSTARSQDLRHGQELFENCVACHSTQPGVMGMGPSLAGIFGRQAGTLAGFRYSNAIKKTGATWDAATLNKYLADPQAFAPGNRMPYSGMPEEKDRADLIRYLETLK